MACLLSLPVEILTQVYKSLEDIDDALHMARSCKYLNSVFEPPNIRSKILGSIIVNAPHHEYDLELTYREKPHIPFPRELSPTIPPMRSLEYVGNSTVGFAHPVRLDQILATEIVWDIVCRWNAMRILFNLYCDSAVQTLYSRSVFPYVSQSAGNKAWAQDGPLPYPSGRDCHSFDKLNQEQKHRCYKRFYRALMAHWASVDASSLSKAWNYSFKGRRKAFGPAGNLMMNDATKAFQQKMDIIETADFVWGFLVRKIFHVQALQDCPTDEREEATTGHHDETELGTWLYFLRRAIQYLRPPHIIELLILSTWACESDWKLDRSGYMRRLGFFANFDEIVEDEAQFVSTRQFVAITAAEAGIEDELRLLEESQVRSRIYGNKLRRVITKEGSSCPEALSVVTDWRYYRRVMWPVDARCKVLFRDETTRQIIQRISNCQP